jgi:hypothetical protein
MFGAFGHERAVRLMKDDFVDGRISAKFQIAGLASLAYAARVFSAPTC